MRFAALVRPNAIFALAALTSASALAAGAGDLTARDGQTSCQGAISGACPSSSTGIISKLQGYLQSLDPAGEYYEKRPLACQSSIPRQGYRVRVTQHYCVRIMTSSTTDTTSVATAEILAGMERIVSQGCQTCGETDVNAQLFSTLGQNLTGVLTVDLAPTDNCGVDGLCPHIGYSTPLPPNSPSLSAVEPSSGAAGVGTPGSFSPLDPSARDAGNGTSPS